MTQKQEANIRRHDFLLTFFNDEPEEIRNKHFERSKEVNGYILVKYFAGDNQKFQVNIFTKESWNKMQEARKQYTIKGQEMSATTLQNLIK